MRNKARGRPPKKHPTSVRMTKGTQTKLQYLARNMEMTQGRILQIAVDRLYDADV